MLTLPRPFSLLAGLAFAFTALSAEAALPPIPQPATSFGAAVSENFLYIYGGNSGRAHEFHNECIKGDFFRLKLPDGTQWEQLPSDRPLLGASMAAHEGWVYRVGGMEARNAKDAKNDLFSTSGVVRFKPGSSKWEELPSLPAPRSSHDVVIVGDTLYVGGGWKLSGGDGEETGGEWHDTVLTLDLKAPEKGWKEQPQKFQRRALAIAEHKGRLWFLGGMDSNDDPSREVDWMDIKTGEWGKGPLLPDGSMAGFGMAACSADGYLLASPLSGKVYALSADLSAWEEKTRLAQARFFHRLLPAGPGQVVAVGGSSRKGQIKEPELVSLTAAPEAAPAAASSATPQAEVKLPSEQSGGAPWPQWRGPQRDGIAVETGWRKDWPAEGPRQLWRAQAGVGLSSCVVAEGRLFTQGNNGSDADLILALDAATGAELWRFTLPCKTSSHEMPIVPSGPGGTPTVAGASVYAITREGDLVCLDVTNGQVNWRKHLVNDLGGKRPVYGYSQSPLVENGRIYLDIGAAPGAEGSTVALDAATGELRWKAGKGEAGYSSARFFTRDGRRYVAMFKGEALDVFDPVDGRVIWSSPLTARDFTNSATPAFVGHRVLVSNTGTTPATLLDWDAGDAANVRPAWSHKQFALLFNSAILHDGALFGFNEKRRGHHEFTCIDSASGESRWVAEGIPTSTFILADNHWLFLTRDGEVILSEAAAGAAPVVKARFKAFTDGGKCYATPTLANGRLYVRNNAGEIAAYDVRPAAVAAK